MFIPFVVAWAALTVIVTVTDSNEVERRDKLIQSCNEYELRKVVRGSTVEGGRSHYVFERRARGTGSACEGRQQQQR